MAVDTPDGGTMKDILMGAAGLGGILWAVWERWLRSRVDAANTNAAVAAAEGTQTVYNMMEARLTTLEKEMQVQRQELAEERQRSRKLELHIFRLESLMRKAGIDPPVFEG